MHLHVRTMLTLSVSDAKLVQGEPNPSEVPRTVDLYLAMLSILEWHRRYDAVDGMLLQACSPEHLGFLRAGMDCLFYAQSFRASKQSSRTWSRTG